MVNLNPKVAVLKSLQCTNVINILLIFFANQLHKNAIKLKMRVYRDISLRRRQQIEQVLVVVATHLLGFSQSMEVRIQEGKIQKYSFNYF